VRTAKYLVVLHKYYNKNVKERFFVVGDLVLKWKTNQDGMHKLSSPCEGPFEVTEVTRPTFYRLAYLDGTMLPNSWHEAPNEKDMYSSCILIISIKHLCFTQCVLSGYYSFSMFYNRPVADHHPFSSSRRQHHLRLIPMRVRDLLSTPRVDGRSLV
jgi:hypothetical protein